MDVEEWTAEQWDALARSARAVLVEQGPMTADELAAVLSAQGQDLGDEPPEVVKAALDEPGMAFLPDRRLCDLEALLDGLMVSRRLTGEEAVEEIVDADPDLLPLRLIELDPLPLAGGGDSSLTTGRRQPAVGAGHRLADHMVMSGTPGWLGGAAGGDLVVFRWQGGVLHVGRAEGEPGDPAEAARHLASAFAALTKEEAATEGFDLVSTALADSPGLLHDLLPPLSEICELAGLEVRDEWVGPAGQDWTLPDGPLHQVWRQALGLGEAEARALRDALDVFWQLAHTEPDARPALLEAAARVAPLLLLDGVAAAFVASTVEMGCDLDAVEAFAQAAARVERSAAGAHYILSRCAERHGDVAAGEARLAAALRADPGFVPALLDAAWYAEDRGDALRALSCLRRAGVEAGDTRRDRLEVFAAPGPAVARRNEPCPCGSRRKYKVCCSRHNGHDLQSRARWLLQKALEFLGRPDQRPVLRDLALARTAADPDSPFWVGAALHDHLIRDLALFDTGVLERFLDVRGALLPADELALGRSWVGARPSLYEVVDVQRGERLQLRDLRCGDLLDLAERLGSTRLQPGAVIYSRVVPVGASHQLVHVELVPPTLHDSLAALLDTDPSAVEIAACFAASSASAP